VRRWPKGLGVGKKFVFENVENVLENVLTDLD
jgi:hypothetical protein